MSTNSAPQSQIDLLAIHVRAEAASPGPWQAIRRAPEYTNIESAAEPYSSSANLLAMVGSREADAEFIAHAREDIPALIAKIEAAWDEGKRAAYLEFETDPRGLYFHVTNPYANALVLGPPDQN